MAEPAHQFGVHRQRARLHARLSGFVFLPLAAAGVLAWLVGRVFLCWGHVGPDTMAVCRETGAAPLVALTIGVVVASLFVFELFRGGRAFVEAIGATVSAAPGVVEARAPRTSSASTGS